MILLAIDFETTGISVENDRVIEVGAALWSTGQNKCLESLGILVKSDKPVSEEITKLTGITQAAVNKFGYESDAALDTLVPMAEVADAYVGQNVLRFDSKVLKSWVAREQFMFPEKLWIDTMYDLPVLDKHGYERGGPKHLGYMAADHGFLNMFPHSALADCQTVLKLISMYDIEKVVERAKSPIVIVQAHQERSENDLAKKQKFRWNPEYKLWWKAVKQMDLDALGKACTFDISIAPPEILLDKLWAD